MQVFGVAGWKNSGKTGLVTRLISHFTELGLKVSTVKHAHHNFDVDHPGRDSFLHREAGAAEVCVVSRNRLALMRELRDQQELPLEEVLEMLAPCDLALIEGYRTRNHPKIETYRSEVVGEPRFREDPFIRAIATDVEIESANIPVFDLDDTVAIGEFIRRETGLL